MLLAGSATVDATVSLPPGTSAAQADSFRSAFDAAAATEYTTGEFASTFGVTGADVTSESATEDSDDDNALAIGLGVGLGLGIPIVVAIILFVWFVAYRRRMMQKVGAGERPPSTGGNDDPAAEPLAPQTQT